MYKYFTSKLTLLILMVPIISSYSQSPTPDKIRALNTYVEFLNESVHGLAVAQILFVNYNKDLNKHVDLESHKINTHITNMELGPNIFDNPDINTSDNDLSALKLSTLTKKESVHLSSHIANVLNRDVAEIVKILNKVNRLRFEIEDFIANNDLSVNENIYQCYVYLEKTVALFDNYAQMHDGLSRKLRNQISYTYKPMDAMFFDMHTATVDMIRELRDGRSSGINQYMNRVEGGLQEFSNTDFNYVGQQKNQANEIVRQVTEMISFAKKAPTTPAPSSYQNNSKAYYIHNSLLLTYFNSISPGFVSKMNKLMSEQDPDFLHYDDRPIKYEVTYPSKMEELEEIVTKKVVNSDAYPLHLTLKTDKNVIVADSQIEPVIEIQNPPEYIELEFFDPDLIDRDSITVTFNDKVILEHHMLSAIPEKLKLEVDTQKGNSVTIFAENDGIIAPNTVAFKYRFNGKGKKKMVKKRLNANMGYELILTIDGFGGLSDERQ